jgi:tRNA A-37 threonylcarbamoyl transferase component Bud32/tetratricopeptide (TPR) repeat protein
MHLICPHCQNPIELIEETPSEEVVCPSCGSSFHLASGSLQQATISHDWGSRHLGRFELLQLLGTGAFGTVWKARDPQLDRTIALKIPRTGGLGTQADRDRFLREARAAAQLRHDSIVAVHEIGEHEGQPYIVSDFVDGINIAEWLSAKKPTFREAAAWVAEVADALQYAHDRGVIHRDIKPSNLILDVGGRLHVMDFGLAKRDAGEITMTHDGQILGTPAYMAPEQIEKAHQVDGRADVYALGVVLYRLLTGELPFRGTTRMLLHQVLHDEPKRPRRLNDRIPRDLETICLKCLEKEPHHRYRTALALAEDLHRFLRGRPILARPIAAWERAWKWARRWPWAAAALSLVAFLLVLLLGGGWYYNARLRDQTHVAQVNERWAVASAQNAIEQRNLALKALDQLVYEVQEKLAPTPATRSLRQKLLDTAIAGLDEIGRSTLGSPPDLSRAVAHQKLADIFRIIGQTPAARRHYQHARSLAEDLLAAQPAAPLIEQVLYQTHMGLGLLDLRAKQFDEAKADFRRAVAMAESIAAARPGQEQARRDLIEAYLQLGRAHGFAGESRPAEDWFRKMQDLARRWVSEEPENHQARDLLSSSYRKLGDLWKIARNYAAARQDYAQAIDIGAKLLVAEPDNFEFKAHLATALDDLAQVSQGQGRLDEARQRFGKAEQLFSALVEADPEQIEFRVSLLHTQWNRAALERDQANFAEAARRFRGLRDQVLRLRREGRLKGRSAHFTDDHALAIEIQKCEAARVPSPRTAPEKPETRS